MMSCMEEKVPLLGCMAVILFSPFSGVPSFSLTLQVRFFFLFFLACFQFAVLCEGDHFCHSLLLISCALRCVFIGSQQCCGWEQRVLGGRGWVPLLFPWIKVGVELLDVAQWPDGCGSSPAALCCSSHAGQSRFRELNQQNINTRQFLFLGLQKSCSCVVLGVSPTSLCPWGAQRCLTASCSVSLSSCCHLTLIFSAISVCQGAELFVILLSCLWLAESSCHSLPEIRVGWDLLLVLV